MLLVLGKSLHMGNGIIDFNDLNDFTTLLHNGMITASKSQVFLATILVWIADVHRM